MKTKVIACIIAVVIMVTAVVPFTVSAETLDYSTIVNGTTFVGSMAGGLGSKFVGDLADGLVWEVIQYGLENPTMSAGGDLESFTIPSYTYITGKCMLKCDGMNDIMVEVTFIYAPMIPQDEMFNARVKNPVDGLLYPLNTAVFTIRRTTGTLRYVIIPNWNGEFQPGVYYYNDRVLLRGFTGNNAKVYEWDGASNYTLTSYSMNLGQDLAFYTADVNSITNDMTLWGYDYVQGTNQHDCYEREPCSFDNRQRTLSQGPSDINILKNTIGVDRRGNGITNSNGVVRYDNQYWTYSNGRYKLYTSWVDTNDTAVANQFELHWTQNNQKVYHYNSTYVGGTTINNENKNSVFNGAFSPAFDLDVSSLADLLEALKDLAPDIKLNLDSLFDDLKLDLFDKLADFYAEMPDIGLEWDPELDINNYLDISPPELPDSGGGGSGDVNVIVTVDVNITRPLVSSIEYNDDIIITFPTITTNTTPAYISEAVHDFHSLSELILSDTGLLPLLLILMISGVAIAIVLKGV